MNEIIKTPENIKKVETAVVQKFEKSKDNAYSRFPLLFTLLSAFGVVATFYGFERIIDKIPLLANNPVILLGVGVGTLIVTGTLYKKLG